MDTSLDMSLDIIDSTKLETLIIATIQTLKRNNKKCGNDEVFDLVSESLENQVERKIFDKELELLIKDQKVKSSSYANRTCLSIPKETEINNTKKDHFKSDFDNLKNTLLTEFENLKSSFFQEVRSFKNQLLEEQEGNFFRLRSSHDDNMPLILERLITQLQDQVSTLKNQVNVKDKLIDSLLEKLEKKENNVFSPECNELQIKPKFLCNNCERKSTPNKEQSEKNVFNNKDDVISISTEVIPTNDVIELGSPQLPQAPRLAETEDLQQTPDKNKRNNSVSQKSDNNADENRNKKTKKTAIVLGDSMVKHINGWEIAKRLNADCKVYVKSFPGATTQCMVDYMKPSIRTQPNHFILHVGTNDLISNSPSEEIARNIVNLTSEMKSENSDVSISTIITRTDKPELNKKGTEVNNHLKEMCKERNIFLIDNTKRIKPNHLNSSKLHLNKKGDKNLGNIFTQHLSKVFN